MRDFDAARRSALISDLLAYAAGRSVDLLPFDDVRRSSTSATSSTAVQAIESCQVARCACTWRIWVTTSWPQKNRAPSSLWGSERSSRWVCAVMTPLGVSA